MAVGAPSRLRGLDEPPPLARPRSIDVADFFCGCGGTSAGLRAAGMQVRLGLDMESDAATTYRANFEDADFIQQDLRAVNPGDLSNRLVRTPGSRLLLSACAPCQPYTNFHRKSARRAEQRTLLLALLPFIDALRPEFVFVENVPGLHKVRGASTFNRFVAALRRRGFKVQWKVVDCQQFGVPQRRRRLVLLGSRLGSIAVPPATHGRDAGLLPLVTVRDCIAKFPPVNHGEAHAAVPNHQVSRLTDLNMRRIRATPTGGGRADWPADLRLACHKTHSGHSDVYGRMHWDGPAPVLTTKCTSISNGRYGHPEQNRPISVREAAALQTFPDDFCLLGGIKSTTRQVGNAVPVRLAEAIGHAIVKHSNDHPRDPADLAPALVPESTETL